MKLNEGFSSLILKRQSNVTNNESFLNDLILLCQSISSTIDVSKITDDDIMYLSNIEFSEEYESTYNDYVFYFSTKKGYITYENVYKMSDISDIDYCLIINLDELSTKYGRENLMLNRSELEYYYKANTLDSYTRNNNIKRYTSFIVKKYKIYKNISDDELTNSITSILKYITRKNIMVCLPSLVSFLRIKDQLLEYRSNAYAIQLYNSCLLPLLSECFYSNFDLNSIKPSEVDDKNLLIKLKDIFNKYSDKLINHKADLKYLNNVIELLQNNNATFVLFRNITQNNYSEYINLYSIEEINSAEKVLSQI